MDKIDSNHVEIDELKERMLWMHEQQRHGQGEDNERVLKKVEDLNQGTLAEIQILWFENERLKTELKEKQENFNAISKTKQ